MRISVFGLGYVGVVSAACLATDGHVVVGVDPNETKVDQVGQGRSPIVETDIDQMVRDQVAAGRLSATMDVASAVRDTDLSLICVGTPSQANGSLDLKYVARVCEQIGAALADKPDFHVVVARSTMLPGTMRELVIPTLERCSGKVAGRDFGVCGNPEFLREGTAVYDYRNPPKTVIGETDTRSGDVLASVYAGLKAPLIRTDVDTAEMVKYADNVWHALKVCFANEIGNVCKALAIDSHRVMDIFCQDTKLNLSPYYLKPGFAFGGSCLPKDVRALSFKARTLDVPLPVIGSILESNELQIRRGVDMIMARGSRRIGILGFSFKAGTDDLRESPMVEVIERLIGKGYDLRLYDRNVAIARLIGANRDFILNHIPHISRLMVDSIDDVLAHGETIVVGNGAREFATVGDRLRDGQALVDFVRIAQERSDGRRYDGICW